MNKSYSPRRLAENEVFFRQKNRSIEENFKNIKEMAKKYNQHSLVNDENMELEFFCECSDENCRMRIRLKRKQYDSIHKSNDTFVVVCGHETPLIEKIVERTDDYCVIQKKIEPPKGAAKLNPTPIRNV